MKDGKIRYAASDRSLEGKINVKLEEGANTIYWHVKFNLQLDPATVSEDSMYVTDLGGYVLQTYISYDVNSNLIVITPLEEYEENYFYILNITKMVKSVSGQNLKRPVIILFKLLEDQISEMQVLPHNTKTPEPIKRPSNYEPRSVKSKVYDDKRVYENVASDRLKTIPLGVNPIYAIISTVIFLALVFVDWRIGLAALILAAVVIIQLLLKLFSKSTRAIISYNTGVRSFNVGKYKDAKEHFDKAFYLDSSNEMYEYALTKVDFYLR